MAERALAYGVPPSALRSSEAAEAALLFRVDGEGSALGVAAGGGADLDEDERIAIAGHEVELAEGALSVADEDAVLLLPEEPLCRALGTGAEPAPPPGLFGGAVGHGG